MRGSGRAAAGVGAVGLLAGFIALGVTLDSDLGGADGAPAAASASPSAPPALSPATMTPTEPSIGDLVQAALRRAMSADTPQDEVDVRSPCASTVVACVQLSTQHVYLVRDGEVVRDGFISSGATDTETPTGMFEVQYKSRNHVSGITGTPMPYAVFFDTDGDALHEGSLDRQSRGCVRLTREDARAFYDELSPGDGVQILP